MRLVLVILITLGSSVAHAAGWSVHTSTDPMTDKPYTVATLSPSTGAGTLRVRCVNGKVFPDVFYDRRVAVYETGVAYRFDNGPTKSFMMRVSPDGTDVWVWMGYPDPAPGVLAQMRKSKRLRVQVANDFMDFDLSGAREALAQVRCR